MGEDHRRGPEERYERDGNAVNGMPYVEAANGQQSRLDSKHGRTPRDYSSTLDT